MRARPVPDDVIRADNNEAATENLLQRPTAAADLEAVAMRPRLVRRHVIIGGQFVSSDSDGSASSEASTVSSLGGCRA